jgi:hypothetical protein
MKRKELTFTSQALKSELRIAFCSVSVSGSVQVLLISYEIIDQRERALRSRGSS